MISTTIVKYSHFPGAHSQKQDKKKKKERPRNKNSWILANFKQTAVWTIRRFNNNILISMLLLNQIGF